VKFTALGNPVVVEVLPEAQTIKNGIIFVDDTITVSTVCSFVIFRDGEKSVSVLPLGRGWLRREVAEQFSSVINSSVSIPVESQPGVIRT
jgi:hypothetical protein